MRRFVEALLLAAATLLVAGAALGWALRDTPQRGTRLRPARAQAVAIPGAPDARVQAPSIDALGRMSEKDLRALVAEGEDLDTSVLREDVKGRLETAGEEVRKIDQSYAIPPARNRSGTASTGGSGWQDPKRRTP